MSVKVRAPDPVTITIAWEVYDRYQSGAPIRGGMFVARASDRTRTAESASYGDPAKAGAAAVCDLLRMREGGHAPILSALDTTTKGGG